VASILFILNDPPYGTERSYNALRLAQTTAKSGAGVRVFLIGDAAACAVAGQSTPDGFYKLDRMLSAVVRHGGEIGVCGTCMDARGIAGNPLVEGAHRSTMDELGQWTLDADKVIVF
jgi:uncharacterized protein involved in oxidation of intracellular sulfur